MSCTMTRQLLLSAADLRRLCLECKCGARLVLDLQSYRGMKIGACPLCGEDYDPRAAQDLAAMARSYENASAAPNSVGACKYRILFFVEQDNPVGS